MEGLSSWLSKALNYVNTIGIADILDILIVAYLIYKAIWFAKRSNLQNLAKGVIVLLLALLLSDLFGLIMIKTLLLGVLDLGFIAVVVLFQPELRRMLERVGKRLSTGKSVVSSSMESAIAQTVLACTEMSASKTGALIIFERDIALNDIMSTGTIINADVTAELIKNIFFNKAPLHDGALIIREDRLASAGCVLPLTRSQNLSKELGMRHRAGIGLSEQSDALVVIVSEETGSISVAIEGMLKRHLTASTLDKILRAELIHEEDAVNKRDVVYYLKKFFKVNANEEKKADK